MKMTYVKINGAWYKELQFKEEYTSQEKLYLWYVDLIHKKNLMIRLANNIDLLERMLSKLPKMEDELRTHKTLYVNKVGGFFIKATEDEIDNKNPLHNALEDFQKHYNNMGIRLNQIQFTYFPKNEEETRTILKQIFDNYS